MKIYVLANQLLTSNLASGGDVLAVEILKNLKYEITFISPSISRSVLHDSIPKAKFISSDNSNIKPQSGFIGGISILLLYIYRTIKTSIYFIKNHKIPVLYLTGDFICNSIPAAVYKLFVPKARIYCNFYHLNPVPWKRENRFLYSITSYILQRFSLLLIKLISDHTFVLTAEGRDILVSLGFSPKKITISGAAVSKEYLIKSKRLKGRYDLLFVGRLNKTKGIYDAIDVLKDIKKIFPKVKMAVAGSSTNNEMIVIDKLIKEHDLKNNFIYLGYISNNEKIRIMRSTPILTAPSHEEGFGMGILESFACGMNVVAYDLPVYKLIFAKYKKYIKYIPVGNTKAMSKELCKLLKQNTKNYKPLTVPVWKDIAIIQERIINKN